MGEKTDVPKYILLADDDADDRLLFQEALKEVDKKANIQTANDGEDLMNILDNKLPVNPMLIFLDLNMPRKNGFECLKEIKKTAKLKDIPVVVYSTSCQQEAINQMYAHGASYYMCKPNNFKKLQTSLQHIFSLGLTKLFPQPSLKDFVIAF